MSKVDVETVFTKAVAAFKSELTDAIDSINNDKGDFELPQIDNESWVEGSLDEKVINYDQAVFAFVDDIQVVVEGNAVSKNVVIEFDLMCNQRADFLDYKRVLRYQRALEEAAVNSWDTFLRGYDRGSVRLLTPVDIKLFNASFYTKVIGIQIEFNLVN